MLIYSFFLTFISAILYFTNNLFFVANCLVLLSVGFLIRGSTFGVISKSVIAGIIALGISSIYSAINLIIFDVEFGLTSDAFLYNQLAWEIASTVPFYEQINPFSFGYVYEYGISVGSVIAHPGFYKILGIFYTIGDWMGVQSISIQIPLIINLISFTFIGYIFYRLINIFPLSSAICWALWLSFILNPILLELVIWARKDLLLLWLSLLSLNAIYKKSYIIFIIVTLVIATLRVPQAIVLVIFFLVYEVREHNLFIKIFLNFNKIKFSLALLLLVIGFSFIPEPEIAFSSLEAFTEDMQSNIGSSAVLLSNAFGVVAYIFLYPLPALFPQDFDSIYRALFIYINIIYLIFYIYKLFSANYIENFIYASAFSFVLVLIGLIISGLISWKFFGFPVIESRYKLFPIALNIIAIAFFVKKSNFKLKNIKKLI